MTEFLSSVKDDLLDRRLRLLLAVLGLALVAAIAYAVLGGGSTTATTALSPATPVAPAEPAAGVSISEAPANPNEAVAETTSGSAYQRAGATHDPFAPLPEAAAASNTKTSSSSPATSTPSSSSSPTTRTPSSSSVGAGTPATTKPSTPAKPKVVYRVGVKFGIAAPGTPTQAAGLTPYPNLMRQQPLPSAKLPLIVFRGVTAGGKSATFTLVGEAILHGNGACLPRAEECQAIDLKRGQTEEFEYLPPTGEAIVYRLEVASITAGTATAAIAKVAFGRESRAGRELLRRIGRTTLPGLHYSGPNGVLAFASRRASGR